MGPDEALFSLSLSPSYLSLLACLHYRHTPDLHPGPVRWPHQSHTQRERERGLRSNLHLPPFVVYSLTLAPFHAYLNLNLNPLTSPQFTTYPQPGPIYWSRNGRMVAFIPQKVPNRGNTRATTTIWLHHIPEFHTTLNEQMSSGLNK